jgi:hypothetical protein
VLGETMILSQSVAAAMPVRPRRFPFARIIAASREATWFETRGRRAPHHEGPRPRPEEHRGAMRLEG